MFDIFKNNPKTEEVKPVPEDVIKPGGGHGDGIVIIKKPEPAVCGGTDATLDTKAPKEILSDDIISFSVSSAFDTLVIPAGKFKAERLYRFSAFAAPSGKGTFVFLEKATDKTPGNSPEYSWGVFRDDLLPAIASLVRECGLAKQNGYHSTTHGLPRNFGGSVNIRYADGEKISFSDNQTPILTYDTGLRIYGFFNKALKGKKAVLPELSGLEAVKYTEERKNGGYTKATLTVNADGTAVNEKASKYDDDKVYKSVKDVSAETVTAIKETVKTCGVLAWSGLPKAEYFFGDPETLTFVFKSGEEIAVTNDRALPDRLKGGFFDIVLELTAKN